MIARYTVLHRVKNKSECKERHRQDIVVYVRFMTDVSELRCLS